MTEYWVSQAKHWCEYCRIYIGGSKQSIAFHEAGKKHKEIVELSLNDMRMRGREKRKHYTPHQVRTLFARADLDHSNAIDLNEFLRLHSRHLSDKTRRHHAPHHHCFHSASICWISKSSTRQ